MLGLNRRKANKNMPAALRSAQLAGSSTSGGKKKGAGTPAFLVRVQDPLPDVVFLPYLLRFLFSLAIAASVYCMHESGVLVALFRTRHPHFYWTSKAAALVLPTRYSYSSLDAAVSLPVATAFNALRALVALQAGVVGWRPGASALLHVVFTVFLFVQERTCASYGSEAKRAKRARDRSERKKRKSRPTNRRQRPTPTTDANDRRQQNGGNSGRKERAERAGGRSERASAPTSSFSCARFARAAHRRPLTCVLASLAPPSPPRYVVY
jgi:hypothetical protein